MEKKKNIETKENAVSNRCYLTFIYKKTEKLVTAIYMVTSFLPDKEPLKWRLRDVAVEHMSDMVSTKDKVILKDIVSFKITSSVAEIISLLELSVSVGLISEMNFTILKKEYDNLLITINQIEDFGYEKTTDILPDNFFDIDEKEELFFENNRPRNKSPKDFYKGQTKGQQYLSRWNLPTGQSGLPTEVSEGDKRQSSWTEGTSQSGRSVKYKKHFEDGNRREKILNIVKDKKKVTIKDISRVVTECSEKTIQRELISMVKDSVLKKEGERRWSKYSLNRELRV